MIQHKFLACTYLASSILLPFATFSFNANAADVPQGTKLAAEQVLNVGVGSEAPSLDPQKMQDNVSSRIANDLFEGLIAPKEDGTIAPGIAIKWEISKDALVYTFHLRPNAKFSDGSPITADDVVFSFRRLVDPRTASTYADLTNMIKNAKDISEGKAKAEELGIKALDNKTVQVTLAHPTPYFLKITAFHSLYIVKKENVEKYKDQFTQPGKLISSGAYSLEYWKIGDKITAVRNPHYWNNAKTVVNTVNYFPISDVNTELQMYQTSQIDFTYDIPSDKFSDLKKTLGKQVQNNPYLSIYYFDLNTQVEPFKGNVKLRQALSMAVDRDVLAKKITGRGEIPSYDIVPLGTSDYKQNTYEWAKWPRPKQIEEAQKLYKEAGYSKEKPVKFAISYNTNLLHKKVVIALASMWEKVLGAKVTLINQEWKVFITERVEGRFQVARDGWIADYNDASTFLEIFQTGYKQNNPKYANPKYDELIKQASLEMNAAKRSEILRNASAVMLNDYPIIPTYSYVTTHLVKPYLGGYSGKNAQDIQYTKDFYITNRQTTADR